MKSILKLYSNPYSWASLGFITAGIMVIGWGLSFPILRPPNEQEFFSQVSPLFWVGLCLCLVSLAALVQTAQSTVVAWLASSSLVVLITFPQFLYLAYGSDAGVMVPVVDYTKMVGNFDLFRDVSVYSYSQWPASVFFQRFLADLLLIDNYASARLSFGLVCLCVACGLYLLWSKDGSEIRTARGAFWGVLVYFAGFYWFFNWQATPYTFALALFVPALALLEKNDIRYRALLFMLLIVGMEAHAIFGVWIVIITVGIFLATSIFRGERHWITTSLIILMLVAQLSLIIYKNTRFLKYLVVSFSGYYKALLDTGASDRVIANQANQALNLIPPDILGRILKWLGYIDLGFILLAFIFATLFVLVNRRLRVREIGLLAAGTGYFLIGMFYAAIGTRSLQIIALAPAFFVADCLAQKGKASQIVFWLCVLSLLLFPSNLMRSHQIMANFVRPMDIPVMNFSSYTRGSLGAQDNLILGEGIRPLDLSVSRRMASTRVILDVSECDGTFAIFDSMKLENEMQTKYLQEMRQSSGRFMGFNERLESLETAKVYDTGEVSLLVGEDCVKLLNILK